MKVEMREGENKINNRIVEIRGADDQSFIVDISDDDVRQWLMRHGVIAHLDEEVHDEMVEE
jgi:hypothetical protein